MAGGKQTPRQRMMGILYLVLLGLIALDIPESLLDAFKSIGDSLNASKINVETGIDKTFKIFEQTKLKDQPERAKPIYDKALKARALADNLDLYVDSLKKIMIDETGGTDPETGDFKGRANHDESVDLMVNRRKYAFELHKRIDYTRQALLSLLTPQERVGIDLSLQVANPPHRTGFTDRNWEQATFGEGIPVAAAVTQLIKIQADTKNAENEVVKKILGEVDQAVVNLDQFSAVAVAPSSYVLQGQPYTAQVFLTASDSKSNPDISVNGSKLAVQGGRATYTVGTGAEGVFTWVGTIIVKQNDGTFKTYKTDPQTYQVAKPSATISPTKMNLLYIGIDNPISISAPSVAKEKLHVTMTGGEISGSAGNYIANVSNLGEATISVSGDVAPGKTAFLGSQPFRIRRIPPPEAEYAGSTGGSVSAVSLRSENYIFAKLENFEFDVKFQITHFTLSVYKPRQDVFPISGSSYQLTGAMHSALNQIQPGCTVVFSNILATGPKNTQYSLKPLVLNAN